MAFVVHSTPNERQVSTRTSGNSFSSPTPWRAVDAYSELSTILDANGYGVLLCRREDAERIVAAMNSN